MVASKHNCTPSIDTRDAEINTRRRRGAGRWLGGPGVWRERGREEGGGSKGGRREEGVREGRSEEGGRERVKEKGRERRNKGGR